MNDKEEVHYEASEADKFKMPNRRKKRRMAPAWQYFSLDEERWIANCNLCMDDVKCTGGCTSGLIRHLDSKHKIHVNDKENVVAQNPDFTHPDRLISKLVAEDGVTFNVLATSQTIRQMFMTTSGKGMPSSPTTIRDIMLGFYNQSKSEYIRKFLVMKGEGKKVSLTLDEWTSAANRRYMNLNVHVFGEFWNLGLARIKGTFTSEACLELVLSKLSEFELSMHDVMGICTDGAAVMKRFGRLTERNHQICLAHGIHLAVVGVLYETKKSTSTASSAVSIISSDEEDDLDSPHPLFDDDEDEELELRPNIGSLIEKVRKIVRTFRKSPLKMEMLVKHSGCNTSLILDTKTRWNSLIDMLERIIYLKEAVQKALIDLKKPSMISEQEYIVIREIVQCLKPVKLAVEALCRRDSNFVTADVALNFMIQKLQIENSEFSKKLLNELEQRIIERRTMLFDVASYLHYGCDNKQPCREMNFLSTPNEKDMITAIKSISEMYEPILHEESETTEDLSEPLMLEVSMESQLSLAINQAMNHKKVSVAVSSNMRVPRDCKSTLKNGIKKEMNIFDTTGVRSNRLQDVLDRMMTIPPSTVESERVFSIANGFCRKIRTRLSDKSLNALVFLKAYFRK